MSAFGVTLLIVGLVVLLSLGYLAKEVWDAVQVRREEEKESENRFARDHWGKGL